MNYPLTFPFFTSLQGLLLAGVAKEEWKEGNSDKKLVHQITYAIQFLYISSRKNEVEHDPPITQKEIRITPL